MLNKDLCSNLANMAEADHRIANHLALLSSYVRLKGSELTRRKTASDATDISLLLAAVGVQINAIAQLHRLLSADESRDSADLSDHLRKICSTLRSAVSRDVVVVEAFEAGCEIPMNKIIPAAQIFTEVMTNAIKHGRRSGEIGRIEASCSKDSTGAIVVDVKDNGPGLCDAGRDQNDLTQAVGGLGFRLVESLVAQIDATVKYVSDDQGLTVRLKIDTPRASNTDYQAPVMALFSRALRIAETDIHVETDSLEALG